MQKVKLLANPECETDHGIRLLVRIPGFSESSFALKKPHFVRPPSSEWLKFLVKFSKILLEIWNYLYERWRKPNHIPYQTGVAACQAFQDWLLFLQLVSSVVPHLLQSFLHPMLPEMIFRTDSVVRNLVLLPVYHSIQHQASQKWTIRCEYKIEQVSGRTNDFNFVISSQKCSKKHVCWLTPVGFL